MSRVGSWAAVVALVMFSLVLAARPGVPASPDDRAAAIAATLRCPVCQGLSVEDSDSQTARDLRADITRRVQAGQSDAEIRRAYVARYGEWILLRPRSEGFGAVVWAVPAVAAAGASAVLVVALQRWRRRGRPATEDDRQLIRRARAATRST